MYLLVAVIVVMVAANLATNRMHDRYYVPMAMLFAVGFVSIGLGSGLSLADLGLAPRTVLPGLLWGLGLVAAVALVYVLGAALPRTRKLFADERATTARGRTIARRALIDVPFGTVLLEETAFRGVLYGMIMVRWGPGWAIAGTAVLFGLWHVLPAIPMHESHQAIGSALGTGLRGRIVAIVLTVLGTAAAGVGFAALRWWTGSLLPPVGLHWALNGLGLAAAWGLAHVFRGQTPPAVGHVSGFDIAGLDVPGLAVAAADPGSDVDVDPAELDSAASEHAGLLHADPLHADPEHANPEHADPVGDDPGPTNLPGR